MKPKPDKRTIALRRFAISITAFTILGAFFLHFEDSWAQPVVALITCYTLELLFETVDAAGRGRPARYRGGFNALVTFLLPAHITALSIALLIYPGSRLWVVVFTCTVAEGSKFILRVPVNGSSRHFLNPSNIGIVVTLLLFPWVGISPPYQFTENLVALPASGIWVWALPVVVFVSGTVINVMLTGKWPLIVGWVGAFIAQALVRAAVFGTPVIAPLLPLTGLVFVLYTNYMITDPGTTPVSRRNQVAFGVATAAVYGVLVSFHVVFGLFYALAIVTVVRGAYLYGCWAYGWAMSRRRLESPRMDTVRA